MWNVLSLIAIGSALIPFCNAGFWWIRLFDFPRLQFALLCLICLTAKFLQAPLTFWDMTLIFGLASALAVDLYRICPYTYLAREESKAPSTRSSATIKILAANIYINNSNTDAILKLIAANDPDVILLLEPHAKWEKQLRPLEKDYPYTVKLPQENTYGMLLYSRHLLRNTRVEHLVDEEVPSIFTDIRWLNQKINFIGLHPRPPRPKEGPSDERDSELMQVAKYARHREDQALIAMGDFNDVAWSHTTRLFKKVSGLLDPRVGRGFFNTYPVKWPFFRFPVDHVFHSQSLGLIKLERLGNIGSDHFPIFAEFALDFSASLSQSQEIAKTEDLEEADELEERGKDWSGPKEKIKKEEE